MALQIMFPALEALEHKTVRTIVSVRYRQNSNSAAGLDVLNRPILFVQKKRKLQDFDRDRLIKRTTHRNAHVWYEPLLCEKISSRSAVTEGSIRCLVNCEQRSKGNGIQHG